MTQSFANQHPANRKPATPGFAQPSHPGLRAPASLSTSSSPLTGPATVGVVRDTATVLGAFADQVACYRSLAKMVERQHAYVQNEQTEELMSLLTERQGVLERLNVIADIVSPARSQWATFTATLTSDDRTKVDSMLSEIKRLLASITAGDERDAMVLQQRKHRIGTEIRATSAAKAVNRSYGASAYSKPKITNVDETR